jgi:hypothetical protein
MLSDKIKSCIKMMAPGQEIDRQKINRQKVDRQKVDRQKVESQKIERQKINRDKRSTDKRSNNKRSTGTKDRKIQVNRTFCSPSPFWRPFWHPFWRPFWRPFWQAAPQFFRPPASEIPAILVPTFLRQAYFNLKNRSW